MAKFTAAIESHANATKADDQEKADQAALDALILAALEAVEHPTPSLQLAERASDQLAAGNWQGAEDTLREEIVLGERSGQPVQTTKPFMDLSKLFHLRGRLEEAWVSAQAATASARASDLSALLAMTLDWQATCALARGNPGHALTAAEEALRVIDPGKSGNLLRAMAHINRGRALLELGEVAGAQAGLESAWAILRSMKPSRASGPVVAHARCFEFEAELHARQKQFTQAVSALRQAIERRQQSVDRSVELNPYPVAAVARDLERLAFIHRENGDAVAAGEALTEAVTLWEQIRLPERAQTGFPDASEI